MNKIEFVSNSRLSAKLQTFYFWMKFVNMSLKEFNKLLVAKRNDEGTIVKITIINTNKIKFIVSTKYQEELK